MFIAVLGHNPRKLQIVVLHVVPSNTRAHGVLFVSDNFPEV
jgi:hypothetical protein